MAEALPNIAFFEDSPVGIAKALLSAAIIFGNEPENVEHVVAMQLEAWPGEELRAIAEGITSMHRRGEAPEEVLLLHELRRLGYGDVVPAGLLGEICNTHPTSQPEKCSHVIRLDFARRQLRAKAETAARLAPTLEADEMRTVLGDLLDVDIPGQQRILPRADILGAPEIIPPIFAAGIYRGKLNLLLGVSGAGKSYLTLMLAVSLVTGRTLFSAFKPSVAGRVLFLAGEDDATVIRARLSAICTARNIPWRDIEEALQQGRLAFVSEVSEPLLTFNEGGIATPTASYIELRRRLQAFDLLVLDPMSVWAAVPNENDNALVNVFAQHLIRLAEEGDTAILLTHHASKHAGASLEQDASRGASALTCASRWAANIRPLSPKGAQRFDVAPADRPAFLELLVSKDSYGPRHGTPLLLRRNSEGVLRETNLQRERLGRISEVLAEALQEEDVGLTRREIVRSTAKIATAIRKRVEDAIGDFSRPELGSAIEHGLSVGGLRLVSVKPQKGGPTRQELRPCDV